HTRFSRDWSSDVCSSDLGSIRGSVRSADGKNVESATVSLYRSQDSSLVKMAVTSKEGVFAIESLEAKSYFLSISAIGFEDYNSRSEERRVGKEGRAQVQA